MGKRIVPEYTLHLGGGVDRTGAVFGRQVLKIPVHRVGDTVLRLLEHYLERRTEGENALSFFRRATDEEIKRVVADLTRIDEATARPEDFTDLGDAKQFEVRTGDGECAA
ncbi:MAG: hypothetical protein HY698_16280 [Deltaproteobacteria bacterium]|nr:hypothetical protein [Deltaproteobacteria bacterium]